MSGVVTWGKVPPALSPPGFAQAEQMLQAEGAAANNPCRQEQRWRWFNGLSHRLQLLGVRSTDYPGKYFLAETKHFSSVSQGISAAPHIPGIFSPKPSLSERAWVSPPPHFGSGHGF